MVSRDINSSYANSAIIISFNLSARQTLYVKIFQTTNLVFIEQTQIIEVLNRCVQCRSLYYCISVTLSILFPTGTLQLRTCVYALVTTEAMLSIIMNRILLLNDCFCTLVTQTYYRFCLAVSTSNLFYYCLPLYSTHKHYIHRIKLPATEL